MGSDERSIEIYKLLDNLEKDLVSIEDKKTFAHIVDSLDKGTEKQKLRFKTHYHLLPELPVFYTMSAYAKFEGCTLSAIRISIERVRNRLVNRSTDEDIKCIKEINEKIEKLKNKTL